LAEKIHTKPAELSSFKSRFAGYARLWRALEQIQPARGVRIGSFAFGMPRRQNLSLTICFDPGTHFRLSIRSLLMEPVQRRFGSV
jgi:hypothetical protein